MNREFLEGKLIGEVIDDDTAILSRLGPEEIMKIKNQKLVSFGITRSGDVTLVKNYTGMDCIIVFVKDKAKAMFYIYELHGTIINEERGLVLAYGHETICMYWLKDGGYNEVHTR